MQCEEEKDNVEDKVEENIKVKLNDKRDTIISKLKEENQTDLGGLAETEPGFDLTEEEIKKFKIWHKGVIPYYLDDLSFDNSLRDRLRQVLNDFNHYTSLGFTELSRPPEDENERWVFFINRRGAISCEDYSTKSFTNAGVQRVVLGYDCLGGDALAATVLALAGVPPQHNAPDRDEHIDVIMDNILPEKRHLFQALENSDWLFYDLSYDFLSAGQYHYHKYTTNGSATIVPKTKLYHLVGEGDGMSTKDILKIRMLYNYVSLNRGEAKASDCYRIFKPGQNFTNYVAAQNDEVIPRKKPELYCNDKLLKNYGHKIDKKKSDDDKIDTDLNVSKTGIKDVQKDNIDEEKNQLTEFNKNKTSEYASKTTQRKLKRENKTKRGTRTKSRKRRPPKATQIILKNDKSDYDTDKIEIK